MGALWMQDIRQLFSWRRLLGLAAVVLFALCCLFALNGQGGQMDAAERISIGVVNKDTSVYSKMLLSFYEENGLFTSYVSVFIGGEEEIREKFEAGGLDMYLVIPEDFADSMVYLEHLPVQAVISTRKPAVGIMLKNLMESYAKYISAVEVHCVALYDVMLQSGMPRTQASQMNEKISVQLILKALSKSDFFERYILENYSAVHLGSFYLHEAVLLLFAFWALFAGMRFQREHHAGIYARLRVIGVGSFSVLLQKFLFFGVQVAFAVLAAALLLHLSGRAVPLQVYFLFGLYAWGMGALMLFMAALFGKMKNYLLASNLFLLLSVILGGGLIPFMYLPKRMGTVAHVMPNYWFLRLIFDAEGNGVAGRTFWTVTALCVAGIFFLLLAAAGLYQGKEGRGYGDA